MFKSICKRVGGLFSTRTDRSAAKQPVRGAGAMLALATVSMLLGLGAPDAAMAATTPPMTLLPTVQDSSINTHQTTNIYFFALNLTGAHLFLCCAVNLFLININ